MVTHVLERAAAIPNVDAVVAALPTGPGDDELAKVASRSAGVFRGSGPDVLNRYARAAEAAGADAVVRLTADCPFLSPDVSGLVVAALDGCDYASNTVRRTYPRGLDTEIFTASALAYANREARDPVEREHVTVFLYRNPDRFRLRHVTADADHSALRWTVDTVEDLAFARAVFDALGTTFEMHDVLRLLDERPELAEINRGVRQKPVT